MTNTVNEELISVPFMSSWYLQVSGAAFVGHIATLVCVILYAVSPLAFYDFLVGRCYIVVTLCFIGQKQK